MKRLRPIILIVAIGVMILIGLNVISIAAGSKEPLRITILFFNDLHGHLMPFKVKTEKGKLEVGGIARLATLIENIRKENRQENTRTFVLNAGDILQGTPLSTVFHGRPDIECFNAIGVDAMTVGNHEFDFGIENFLSLKKMAAFPFISSNIIWKDSGNLVCKPLVSYKVSENIFLSVIGATTRTLLVTTKPEYVKDLAVLNSVETVKEAFKGVKDKGPVILLSHSKFKTDQSIAGAVPELAAVIGGHDQILLSPYRKVGEVPIFQAFEKGRYLGRIDFRIEPLTAKTHLINHTYIPVTADIEPDPRIERIVRVYHERLDKSFKEVLGKSKTFLDGERERVRYEETTLGNLVTDIMRQYTGADIALLNGGSLRASIDVGPVTIEDVFRSMPYSNEIIIVELTGEDIRQLLARSVQGTRADEDGGFLQVSGIRFTVGGHKVEKIVLSSKNRMIQADKKYRVAITDFLASGGDGYTLFVDKSHENTRLPLRELIVETIRTRGSVTSAIEGRILRVKE